MSDPSVNQPEEPTTTPKMTDAQVEALLKVYQRRIGTAIFKVSEGVSTQMRRYVDMYYSHVHPGLADKFDQNLPTALRRQPNNIERTSQNAKPFVLYFLIGSAIVGYYEAVRLKEISRNFDRRVELLEDIGKRGYNRFDLIGNDSEGYTLVHRSEKPIPFLSNGGINDERNTDTESA